MPLFLVHQHTLCDITSEMKALIDRSGMTTQANGDLYKRKLGAAVVSVGRAGAIHAFDTINHFFLATVENEDVMI